ncbi:uncharacterized protein PHALS_15473 [Plasmopara halstedii]|uniref:Uncharacterized protein n=1 Tax=Plasmopara halstedii TaxID=4781 RepID=A0A0N7L592_PLAHL|nr:uncharacterized protein PHALS_15473 [Plasmopara halstedii]CEG40827.1 hypothetical protein PHALS_15473 [Plasmopara halstedii]|eukprot:XP_024577196.1 hypothetical protein PHALS_15473 [Plasmopara halstedii]
MYETHQPQGGTLKGESYVSLTCNDWCEPVNVITYVSRKESLSVQQVAVHPTQKKLSRFSQRTGDESIKALSD